jgi:hypothetical protein
MRHRVVQKYRHKNRDAAMWAGFLRFIYSFFYWISGVVHAFCWSLANQKKSIAGKFIFCKKYFIFS